MTSKEFFVKHIDNLKRIFRKILNIQIHCEKCDSISGEYKYCELCRRYFEYTRLEEIRKAKEKEEWNRRSWIQMRDKILKVNNA